MHRDSLLRKNNCLRQKWLTYEQFLSQRSSSYASLLPFILAEAGELLPIADLRRVYFNLSTANRK